MKSFMAKTVQIFTGVAAAVTLSAGRAMAMTVQEGAEIARAEGMPENLIGPEGVFTQISNTVLMVIGALSVFMLIYGGFRYIISGGDSKKVTDAKNTVLYAIIGLVIAVFSYAIINFILNAIGAQTLQEQVEQSGMILGGLR